MFYFLGSFFFIAIFVILIILVLGINLLAHIVGGIKNLWNLVTGKGINTNTNNTRRTNYYYEDNHQQSTTSQDQGNRPHSRGVFSDDEGTYVDFEEIKE